MIWQRVQKLLSPSRYLKRNDAAQSPASTTQPVGDDALAEVKGSLNALLQDAKVPSAVRAELAPDYAALEAMLEKLEHGHIHIAAFGRVSVGKSSLLNALLGESRFHTSALHGATKRPEFGTWQQSADGHVLLYDTPGINEIDGENRERLAHEVAANCDLVLFVADGDLTETESNALRTLAEEHRPILLVLNKADQYTQRERELLLARLVERTEGTLPPENILACSAAPAERIYVEQDQHGRERESRRRPPTDVAHLQERLWHILETEGKTLAAVNAGLFAGRVSDQIAERITALKQNLAKQVVSRYCLAKGLAVAFNPVPVADLVAAATLDVTMIIHLSRVYGLPVTGREATRLIRVISTQMAALMGTVWAMHLLSSALKLGSSGLSTVVTASAQGSVAYYGTLVVGRAAEHYFRQGKSWGEGGPKRVVKSILESIDRTSVLRQARADISARLSRN